MNICPLRLRVTVKSALKYMKLVNVLHKIFYYILIYILKFCGIMRTKLPEVKKTDCLSVISSEDG